jgi:hypothetical protein
MNTKKTAGAVAVFAMAWAFSGGPAASQLILSCLTLHNDLANFDRRASIGHRRFMPNLEHLREAADEAAAQADGESCFDRGAENCESRLDGKARKYYRLKEAYLLSHLGGSDPIRLRIIGEMQKLGCPLPDHVVELQELLEVESGRRESRYRQQPGRTSEQPSPLK